MVRANASKCMWGPFEYVCPCVSRSEDRRVWGYDIKVNERRGARCESARNACGGPLEDARSIFRAMKKACVASSVS